MSASRGASGRLSRKRKNEDDCGSQSGSASLHDVTDDFQDISTVFRLPKKSKIEKLIGPSRPRGRPKRGRTSKGSAVKPDSKIDLSEKDEDNFLFLNSDKDIDSQESTSQENKEFVVEFDESFLLKDERLCGSCKHIVPISIYKDHLKECFKKFSLPKQESKYSTFSACISESSNKENEQTKKNNGTDTQDAKKAQVLPCPLCSKPLKSKTQRQSHLKSCSQSNGVDSEKLVLAVRLQEKQAEERNQLGLPFVSEKPSSSHMNKENELSSNDRPKRRGKSSTKDPDLAMAIALSRSIAEEEAEKRSVQEEKLLALGLDHIVEEDRKSKPVVLLHSQKGAQKVGKGRGRGRKNMRNTILTSRSVEERERIISEKVATLLTSGTEITIKENISKGGRGRLARFKEETCSLWNSSCSNLEKPLEDYYVKDLEAMIQPKKAKVGNLLRRLSDIPGRLNVTLMQNLNDENSDSGGSDGEEDSIIDGYCTQLAMAELLGSQELNITHADKILTSFDINSVEDLEEAAAKANVTLEASSGFWLTHPVNPDDENPLNVEDSGHANIKRIVETGIDASTHLDVQSGRKGEADLSANHSDGESEQGRIKTSTENNDRGSPGERTSLLEQMAVLSEKSEKISSSDISIDPKSDTLEEKVPCNIERKMNIWENDDSEILCILDTSINQDNKKQNPSTSKRISKLSLSQSHVSIEKSNSSQGEASRLKQMPVNRISDKDDDSSLNSFDSDATELFNGEGSDGDLLECDDKRYSSCRNSKELDLLGEPKNVKSNTMGCKSGADNQNTIVVDDDSQLASEAENPETVSESGEEESETKTILYEDDMIDQMFDSPTEGSDDDNASVQIDEDCNVTLPYEDEDCTVDFATEGLKTTSASIRVNAAQTEKKPHNNPSHVNDTELDKMLPCEDLGNTGDTVIHQILAAFDNTVVPCGTMSNMCETVLYEQETLPYQASSDPKKTCKILDVTNKTGIPHEHTKKVKDDTLEKEGVGASKKEVEGTKVDEDASKKLDKGSFISNIESDITMVYEERKDVNVLYQEKVQDYISPLKDGLFQSSKSNDKAATTSKSNPIDSTVTKNSSSSNQMSFPKNEDLEKGLSSMQARMIYDWSSLLATGEGSDVVIKVVDGLELNAHSVVFLSRCSSLYTEAKNCNKNINWNETTFEGAYVFLVYLYTSECSIKTKDDPRWMDVFDLALKYNCDELVSYLECLYKIGNSPEKNKVSTFTEPVANFDKPLLQLKSNAVTEVSEDAQNDGVVSVIKNTVKALLSSTVISSNVSLLKTGTEIETSEDAQNDGVASVMKNTVKALLSSTVISSNVSLLKTGTEIETSEDAQNDGVASVMKNTVKPLLSSTVIRSNVSLQKTGTGIETSEDAQNDGAMRNTVKPLLSSTVIRSNVSPRKTSTEIKTSDIGSSSANSFVTPNMKMISGKFKGKVVKRCLDLSAITKTPISTSERNCPSPIEAANKVEMSQCPSGSQSPDLFDSPISMENVSYVTTPPNSPLTLPSPQDMTNSTGNFADISIANEETSHLVAKEPYTLSDCDIGNQDDEICDKAECAVDVQSISPKEVHSGTDSTGECSSKVIDTIRKSFGSSLDGNDRNTNMIDLTMDSSDDSLSSLPDNQMSTKYVSVQDPSGLDSTEDMEPLKLADSEESTDGISNELDDNDNAKDGHNISGNDDGMEVNLICPSPNSIVSAHDAESKESENDAPYISNVWDDFDDVGCGITANVSPSPSKMDVTETGIETSKAEDAETGIETSKAEDTETGIETSKAEDTETPEVENIETVNDLPFVEERSLKHNTEDSNEFLEINDVENTKPLLSRLYSKKRIDIPSTSTGILKQHVGCKDFTKPISSSSAIVSDDTMIKVREDFDDSALWREEFEPSLEDQPQQSSNKTKRQLGYTATPHQKAAARNPVTPMPDYKKMPTPDLKIELKRYGIKPISRNKAVKILEHVYDKTHPFVTDSEAESSYCETPVRPQPSKANVTRKKTTAAPPKKVPSQNRKNPAKNVKKKDQKEPPANEIIEHSPVKTSISKVVPVTEEDEDDGPLNSSQSSSLGSEESDRDCFEESMLLGIGDDDGAMPSTQQVGDLESKVIQFITSDPELHRKVLLYEPFFVEDFHATLKANGVKCKMKTILDILDNQCITFRTHQSQSRTRKRRCKGKSGTGTPSKSPRRPRRGQQ